METIKPTHVYGSRCECCNFTYYLCNTYQNSHVKDPSQPIHTLVYGETCYACCMVCVKKWKIKEETRLYIDMRKAGKVLYPMKHEYQCKQCSCNGYFALGSDYVLN